MANSWNMDISPEEKLIRQLMGDEWYENLGTEKNPQDKDQDSLTYSTQEPRLQELNQLQINQEKYANLSGDRITTMDKNGKIFSGSPEKIKEIQKAGKIEY